MRDYGSSDDEYYYRDDDDDDPDDSSEGFQEPETEVQWPIGKAPSCQVIKKVSRLAAQREDLQRIMDLLSLKEHHARTLLIHYRWDVDKVFAVFVEKGKDRLYAEAGVTVEEYNDISSSHWSELMCHICIEDVPANETTTMDCGHCFCNNFGFVEEPQVYNTMDSIYNHICGWYSEATVKNAECAKMNSCAMFTIITGTKLIDSSNAEVNLIKENIQLKITKLEERELEFQDFSWVTNGLYRLFRSRSILSYSYPFAYYMFGDDLFKNEMTTEEREIKQNLFEDQQQQLEANVEKLSMFLEEPFDGYAEDGVMETRMKIITLSTLTNDLCKKL